MFIYDKIMFISNGNKWYYLKIEAEVTIIQNIILLTLTLSCSAIVWFITLPCDIRGFTGNV